MLANYFIVAFRSILRHKLFSAINIGGLAIGLAAFWMIALYIGQELSFDRHQANGSRIFRIAQHAQWDGGNFHGAITPAPYAAAMKSDFPEVAETVRIDTEGGGIFNYGDKQFKVGDMLYVDNTFFKIFSFNFLYGDRQSALSKPQSIVMTQSLATKVFGDPSVALNKTLSFGQETIVVTGVIEDVPANSHFTFSGLLPMKENTEASWNNAYLYTYVMLRDEHDLDALETKMPAFFDRHMKATNPGMDYRAELQPLTSIHLHSDLEYEIGANGDIQDVYVFSLVAVLILVIASINYMNLSTARSSLRIRETGLRKVAGSSRRQLMMLFLAESVFITVIASALAIFLITFSMPWFQSFTGSVVDIWHFGTWTTLGMLGVFAVLAGFLSGIYPAFFLSGFKLVPALKGFAGNHAGDILFRKSLVVFQFVITIAMIAGSLIIYRQLSFVMHKDLGFNKDQVMTFHLNGQDIRTKVQAIREQLLQSPLIEDAATAGNPIGNNNIGGGDYKIEVDGQIEDRTRMANYLTIDEDFIPTLQITLKEGRNFSKENVSDEDRSVIVNETLVKDAGWGEGLGKKIKVGTDSSGKPIVCEVVGVVKDFNIYSLQHKVEPLILQLPQAYFEKDNMYVRVAASDVAGAIRAAGEVYKKFDASGTFEYNFLDENFERQYKAEQIQGRLLLTFTVLAISIACLGLFGLITFTTEQRTKEIGIRKVLGSSVTRIVILLAKDLLALIFIAIVLATPLAWYAMNQWLLDFAYHIEITLWIFAAAGVSALIVAMVTVCSQAVRSAMANPVESLRSE